MQRLPLVQRACAAVYLHRLCLYEGPCSSVSAQTVLGQRPMQQCFCTDCACAKAYALMCLHNVRRPIHQCVCTDYACAKAHALTCLHSCTHMCHRLRLYKGPCTHGSAQTATCARSMHTDICKDCHLCKGPMH